MSNLCAEAQQDPVVLEAQAAYLMGVLAAGAAVAIGLDTVRGIPSATLRRLFATALALNVCLATVNWLGWVYPFNCQWRVYRKYDYGFLAVALPQTYTLACLSVTRVLSVYGKTDRRYLLLPATIGVVPVVLAVVLERAYLAQVVSDEGFRNSQYDILLLSLRNAASYLIEAGSLVCIVARILWVTMKGRTNGRGGRAAGRTAWMLASVCGRIATVTSFYVLAAWHDTILNGLCYAVADSVLLIMIAVDEVRFKAFFAADGKT